ncbi:MAG TPA: hypothetical protein VFD97_03415 [Acidimicrobiia bacterium]|nr:hypothetical protein [Acidimicrobiia bacterium]
MKETDLALIVDLVAGRLPPEEEQAALALVTADPGLRTEYESQRAIAALLADTPSPSMTPQERVLLHTELKAQLHFGDPSPVVTVAPSRWHRWLAPLGGLAVAAAVIVGAVVVLPGTLSGDNANDSFDLASAPTTTAAASSERLDMFGSDGQPALEGPTEDASASETGPDAITDGAVGQAYNPSVERLDVPYVAAVDLDELAATYSSDPTLVDESLSRSSASISPMAKDQALSCLEVASANIPGSAVIPLVVTAYDGVDAVIVAVTPETGDSYLVVYALDSCTELADTRS